MAPERGSGLEVESGGVGSDGVAVFIPTHPVTPYSVTPHLTRLPLSRQRRRITLQTMFSAVMVAYWLSLSTWFGSVLFIAVAAPIIFRTIRDADPTLPRVLSVNLEGQHGTLLAGTIVGNLLDTLSRVQLVCAAVLFLAIVAQWLLVDLSGMNVIFPAVRSAMYLAAVAMLIYDWRVVWPRIKRYRQEYIDHADEPDIANPAKDQFDHYHRESVNILRNVLFLLLGIILFSGSIQLASIHITMP